MINFIYNVYIKYFLNFIYLRDLNHVEGIFESSVGSEQILMGEEQFSFYSAHNLMESPNKTNLLRVCGKHVQHFFLVFQHKFIVIFKS